MGLAIAIELARAELRVLLVERRARDDADARPQLLVARAGDLANLAQLGVGGLVTMLETRVEKDYASGTTLRGDVDPPTWAPPQDLRTLAAQRPIALVPIGQLQAALMHEAEGLGITTVYDCQVTQLRRHAERVSLQCADGSSLVAAIAIVATGAARSLIARVSGFAPPTHATSARMIAALFGANGDAGRWVRAELPVPGNVAPTRCTFLQTRSAGTALLVDPQLASDASLDQVHHTFAEAARVHGLAGERYIAAPQVFMTSLTKMHTRYVGLDGRAPIIIAGDAAQTGHVFSGQTCFVNLALAIGLCKELRAAKAAIVERLPSDPAIARMLGRYDAQSELGASILARASARHYAAHAPGRWALAGVARARVTPRRRSPAGRSVIALMSAARAPSRTTLEPSDGVSMRLLVCLLLAACSNDNADPEPDAGGNSPTVTPKVGGWEYDDITPVSSTCPTTVEEGGDGNFAIDAASSSSFHVVPADGTPAFSCTLTGSAFDCADRLTRTQDLRPSIDAVLTARATARGTFASSTHATGRQEANVTCAGTQCPATFPCAIKVDFSIRAR